MAKISKKFAARAKGHKKPATNSKAQSSTSEKAVQGRASKQKSPPPTQLSSVWQLSRKSLLLLWNNKKLFIGITLIYGFLNLILAEGLASSPAIGKLKGQLNSIFGGHTSTIGAGLKTFVTLGSTGNSTSNSPAGVYQFFLVIIVSLATIWALRQAMAGKHIKIRDAYYRGMYPLVQFILTLLVIGLELLPMIVGATLYTIVINNNIAVSQLEKLIWVIIFGLLTCFSLFLICGSVFALYVVTLPDMAPIKAVRSAARLVRHRRSMILPKLLFLPCALLVIAVVIIVPITLWVTPLAKLIYFLMTIFVVPVINSYLYNLYQELVLDNE